MQTILRHFKIQDCKLENSQFMDFLCDLHLREKLEFDKLFLDFNLKSEDFFRYFAKGLGLEFVDFECIDEKLCEFLPFELLKNYKILVLKSDETSVYLLSSKPCSLELLENLQGFFRDKFIKVFIADSFKISKELKRLSVQHTLKILSTKLKEEWDKNLKQEQSCVSQIFNFITGEALKFGASDIHIEARENDALVRFRIDGVLGFFCALEKEVSTALIFHIKLLAHLNVAEQRKAQDGSFTLEFDTQEYDFRVSSLPLLHGESVVLRILKHDMQLLNLEMLDLGTFNLNILKKAIFSPHGMVLLTGPTGSGKSTTLYACLNALKSMEKKIITAEDPIEYKMPLIQQIVLNSKAGLDFNNALRAILRQDPDIIMIGEIRDEESLDIAIKAALTGHLLLSTLHTNDAIGAIDRLLNMGAKPYLLATSLNLIIAQRLVRKLCVFCREKVSQKHSEFEGEFYHSLGCEHCHYSGFHGRELVAEFLFIDEKLSALIRNNAPSNELLTYARKQGFKTMLEFGLEKARQGITSIDELLRVLK